MRVPPIVMDRLEAAREYGHVELRVTKTGGRSGPSWRLVARAGDPELGHRDFFLMSHSDQAAVEAVRERLEELHQRPVVVTCPAGHRFEIPSVVYGLPTPETMARAERGEILLGGCDPDDSVRVVCPRCGAEIEWASRWASGAVSEAAESSSEAPI